MTDREAVSSKASLASHFRLFSFMTSAQVCLLHFMSHGVVSNYDQAKDLIKLLYLKENIKNNIENKYLDGDDVKKKKGGLCRLLKSYREIASGGL